MAALGSHLDARSHGGAWLVRMEDVDPPRVLAGAADAILRSLEAYGFEWDGPVMWQGRRGAAYEAALETLPDTLRQDLHEAWGEPAADPSVRDGLFQFPATRRGHALIALQPERGEVQTRDDSYHDLSRTPRHRDSGSTTPKR